MRRSITALMGAVVAAGTIATASATPAHPASAAARPASEHVPTAVDDVVIAYRDSSDASHNQTIELHGSRADDLIDLFNALKREPRDAVHCLAMGTAHTSVRFKGTHHKWVTTQSICTNVMVTRDGEQEPTLIPSRAWNKALTQYLGHSPSGTGSDTPAG